MLDKLTRVSPPQTDSLSKNQRSNRPEDLGAKDIKHDFNESLKSQLKKDQKKIDLKEKPKSLQAEQKESQPGEKKKRVAKNEDRDIETEDNVDDKGEKKLSESRTEKFDPTMISMNMVSNESEVEIPDTEENLATIEESNSDSKLNLNTQSTAQSLFSEPQLEPILPESAQAEPSFDLSQTEESVEVVAPSLTEQSESSSKLSQVEAAPAAFQQKVMEALKNENVTLPEGKLEELKDQLASLKNATQNESQTQTSGASAQSKSDELMKNKSEGSDQQSSGDAKSTKEELLSKETLKMETHHTGQTEFSSHLAHRGIGETQSTDKAQALPQSGDLEPSVNELMNQANYLVTKGGGEVTLKMNSVDGMGEVHLKVMMDNGKMNIELNTEDKSVKKLIEDSLSDLRSSLAARQISLEHVKINSVNATSTENNSQSMQNNSNNSGSESNQSKTFAQLQQQMQQQSQQHQLRQQSQNSFTRNNFDLERPVVLPMVNVQKSIAKNYYGLNKGSSLNAVA